MYFCDKFREIKIFGSEVLSTEDLQELKIRYCHLGLPDSWHCKWKVVLIIQILINLEFLKQFYTGEHQCVMRPFCLVESRLQDAATNVGMLSVYDSPISEFLIV